MEVSLSGQSISFEKLFIRNGENYWKQFFVYYESRKRDLKTRPIYECRCDERIKTKVEKSTRLSMCFEVIGTPSTFKLTRKSEVLRGTTEVE